MGSKWRTLNDNQPYEWGNPTRSSPGKLLSTLTNRDNMGDARTQVYWFSHEWRPDFPVTNINGVEVYNMAFVVTKGQIDELCGNASCVIP
jgi:hypothetical protein